MLLFGYLNVSGQQIAGTEVEGVFDTTVNAKLKLLDPASIREIIGDQRKNIIEDQQASRVQLTNKTNSEYLILYHLDGANGNSFNEFEVGRLMGNHNAFKTTMITSFYTESGVHLGMSVDSLMALKGKTFKRTDAKENTTLSYRVTDTHALHSILKRYNMPFYEAHYFFKENKLIKFVFGFPNL